MKTPYIVDGITTQTADILPKPAPSKGWQFERHIKT
jgi:hypothetical protein